MTFFPKSRTPLSLTRTYCSPWMWKVYTLTLTQTWAYWQLKKGSGVSRTPLDLMIALLRLSLTRNDFMFNDSWFLQVKGTAMGK